jgi:hypothetical protein
MGDEEFKILKEIDDVSYHIDPGDSIVMSHTDENGREAVVLEEVIDESIHVTRAVIFKLKNALGMKKGIGGVFGEKE